METCGIEDLLASFGSDSFAVQSQPERDLRASLISFFALGHDPNGLNHRSHSGGHAQDQLMGRRTPTQTWAPCTGVGAAVMGQADELPPQNTPIGSPIPEDIFMSSALNHGAQVRPQTEATCSGCLHAIAFPGAPFPHHQACQHAQFLNATTILQSHPHSSNTTQHIQHYPDPQVLVEQQQHHAHDQFEIDLAPSSEHFVHC